MSQIPNGGLFGVELREPFRDMPAPHNGTPTSRAAAEAVTPESAGSQRARILEVLALYPGGLTDEQISETAGICDNATRPRRGELVAAGKVKDSGTTRLTIRNRKAVVWVLA